MKLVMAIVHDHDALNLMDVLSENKFSTTKLTSTGGFLRAGNTTILCGCEDNEVNNVIDIISKNCKSRKQFKAVSSAEAYSLATFVTTPMEIITGGATIFVVNVEEFKKV